MNDLERSVDELLKQGQTPIQTRSALVQQGFLEDEVDKALNKKAKNKVSSTQKKTNRLLSTKESFDRLGYGFASPQFVNILFWLSGANYFLIGIMNGLKTILSLVFSSVLQEYVKYHTVPKNKIANAGLLFGFSFFIMAFAALAKQPYLFAIGFLMGSLGIVTYGDLYSALARAMMKHERRSHFLQKAAFYGVIISGLSMLVSGVLIDEISTTITLFGMELKIHGFLISFMITAFAFIIGSYVMSMLPDPREKKFSELGRFLAHHTKVVGQHMRVFTKNPHVLLLLLPAILTGLLQILGTSYYGIFIFQEFKTQWFGGFTNVAILYAVALFASMFGPTFTKLMQNNIGLAPNLVFGTLLSAILPFTLVFNPHFYAIMAALVCSVIGAAIIGTAQGLIVQKIMDFDSRKSFFVTQSFFVAIPYLVLLPLGAWFAQSFGLEQLFLVIAYGLALVVAPLYFLLVIMTNKMRL